MGIKHKLINGLAEVNTHLPLNVYELSSTFYEVDNGVKVFPMTIAITETSKDSAKAFLIASIKETLDFNNSATDLIWSEKPFVEEVSPGIWTGRCRLVLLDLSGDDLVVLVGEEA